jgi:hypothetical protein
MVLAIATFCVSRNFYSGAQKPCITMVLVIAKDDPLEKQNNRRVMVSGHSKFRDPKNP